MVHMNVLCARVAQPLAQVIGGMVIMLGPAVL